MNNLKKIGLSALAGSLVAFSATAGEMTVTGGAAAYMTSTDENSKTTFSMDNHVDFKGTTELDNGFEVSYAVQFDGDEGDQGEGLDNNSITVNTNGMGTFVWAGHGGSSAMSMMDDKTPNAYEEAWDSLGGTDAIVINGHSTNNMLTYTSESFSGVQFTVAYVPGEAGDAAAAGTNEEVYVDFGVTVTPEMVDGLTVGYAAGSSEATAGTEVDESTMYATYAVGGFTIGYQSSEFDAPTSTDSDDSTSIGISYAVNDDFSVSWNQHTVDVGSTTTDQESTGISASYTMGGITIAGHRNEMDAVAGASGTNREGYELMLSFAF
jgi:outer membrane protein OmpU